MYKLGLNTDLIQRKVDGAWIPQDPGNRDYALYLKWLEEGNTPEPAETEQEELDRLLTEQKQKCIELLNESECKVSQDPPYPDDVDAWKVWRADLRSILKGSTIESIPDKPFGE